MNLNLMVIGIILLVLGLSLYLSIPLYYPGYSSTNNIFKSNQGSVIVGPGQTLVVKNISGKSGDALIFLTLNGNANVSLLTQSGQTIISQQKEISVALNKSNYSVAIVNLDNKTTNITFTYGIFNAISISNFYYSLGILQTFLEIVTLAGGAMILWQVISWIVSRRK
ncbi:hypothetical protein [Metallosphaera hakonensis]|uniref:Uncharacterized protein n=1 Tax=Metallosphaera hakonensis JCM 8857 = DSM 7519 TaxID=1293036 RepID=A0A2U9IUI3_9CREN|nr:hypothetical protein [Metallosphaera hakonensis]AWR99643.1 hypothetical protein DFR87_08015 [Metallosphaera hakonensis JCM 8857 = DSM 7519]